MQKMACISKYILDNVNNEIKVVDFAISHTVHISKVHIVYYR